MLLAAYRIPDVVQTKPGVRLARKSEFANNSESNIILPERTKSQRDRKMNWNVSSLLAFIAVLHLLSPAFAQFGGVGNPVRMPVTQPIPKLVGTINFADSIPQANPALTYPGNATLEELEQWRNSQRDAVNELWNTSQVQAERQRNSTRDGNRKRAINRWIQELRLITIKWVHQIDEAFQKLYAAASDGGNGTVPPFEQSPFGPRGGIAWPGPVQQGVPPPTFPGRVMASPVSQTGPGPQTGVNSGTSQANSGQRDDDVSVVPLRRKKKRGCEIEGEVTYWFGSTMEKRHALSAAFNDFLQQEGCPWVSPDKVPDWAEDETVKFLQVQNYQPVLNRDRKVCIIDGNTKRTAFPDVDIKSDLSLGRTALGEVKITYGPNLPRIPEALTDPYQRIVYPKVVVPTAHVHIVDVTPLNWQIRTNMPLPVPLLFFKIRYMNTRP